MIFEEAFQQRDRHRVRNFVSTALDARNATSHLTLPLQDSDVLRYLDAMHELLRVTKAPEEATQALTRFFSTPGNQVIRWARCSLLVIFLAFTGHVVTLVFYLLTLAALKVLRAQIIDAEPVTV